MGQTQGNPAMSETVENLVLDLLVRLQRKERTFKETMEAWRTSCPRLPVWEEANERGLLETSSGNGRLVVRVSRTVSRSSPSADHSERCQSFF